MFFKCGNHLRVRSKSQSKKFHRINIADPMQRATDKVSFWAKSVGFQISHAKTVSVNFHLRRNLGEFEQKLKIDGKVIANKDTVRFLGLTFDRRLSWVPHLKALKQSCCLKPVGALESQVMRSR